MIRDGLVALLAACVLVPFIHCSEKKPAVVAAPGEAALMEATGFDRSLVMALKEEGEGPLERLTGLNVAFEEYDAPGISVPIPERKAERALFALRKKAAPLGYMVFITERHYGYAPDKLTLVRGADPFEILRIKGTNGINYDIDNRQVIERLKKWDAVYGLDIIAAGFDFVEAVFRKMPPDINRFAEEVYGFCPDVVDQGTGTVKALADEMARSGRLYLWWD